MLLDYLPVRQGSGRADGAVRGALDKPRPFKRGHFEVLGAKGDGLCLEEASLKMAKAAPDAMRDDRRGEGARSVSRWGGHAPCLAPPPYSSSEAGASTKRHILHIWAPANPRRDVGALDRASLCPLRATLCAVDRLRYIPLASSEVMGAGAA
jgi:hypothetical protein